jgi:hypothetical protein
VEVFFPKAHNLQGCYNAPVPARGWGFKLYKTPIMQPSKEYLKLKKGIITNVPFIATLTRPLAIELLLRASDCRPINNAQAMEIAFSLLGNTFEINTDSILINYDSDNLWNGVQRLAGFLLSGLKKYDIQIMFVSPGDKRLWPSILPTNSHTRTGI